MSHGLIQLRYVVRADLMAQSSRSGVDEQHDPVFLQVVLIRRVLIKYFIDKLHFEEMITGTERSKLWTASQLRAFTDGVGICAGNATPFFSVIKVCFRAHVVLDRPFRSSFKNPVQIGRR